MNKKTTKQFILEASNIHNNRYDYSLVEYKNTQTKVKIVCPDHGIFEKRPVQHISAKVGCPKCSKIERITKNIVKYGNLNMTRKLTPKQQQWLDDNGLLEPPKCKMCNNDVKWVYYPPRYATYCSRTCRYNDTDLVKRQQQTLLKRYGDSNPAHGQQAKEKIKQTNLQKYGVENVFQSSQMQQYARDQHFKKYGVEYSTQSLAIQEKTKQTNLEKYGVEWNINSEHTKTLKLNTWKKYKGNHPLKDPNIRQQIVHTNQQRYGVDYPLCLSITHDNINNTNLQKYGVKRYSQQHMTHVIPLLEDYNWMNEQYTNQNKTTYQIADELGINQTTVLRYIHNHNIDITFGYQYSQKSIQWLESVMQSDNIHIQHALNGGEYQIPGTRYKADGYCQETNTIYEFHGDYWHGNPEIYDENQINETVGLSMKILYNKTIEKENKIKELGYNLVTIWESHFNNKEQIQWLNQN